MADKTTTIKTATDKQIDELLVRLRKESELQRIIAELKRKSMPKDPLGNYVSYEQPEISTEAPIESLYHKVDDVLAHFGVVGMKWGVRRSGNSPGIGSTKKRQAAHNKKHKKPRGSEDYIQSRQLKAKGSKNLSNKELQALTQRMQLEKQLRELKASDYTKGMEVAKAVLSVGTTAASIYALSTTPLGQAVKKHLTT